MTRTGVHIDRIASAWLIRRFIDPQARFKFVPAEGYQPAAGRDPLRHVRRGVHPRGRSLHVRGPARASSISATRRSARIAEIVHDIDLKEAKFGRPETAGVDHLVTGIAWTSPTTRVASRRRRPSSTRCTATSSEGSNDHIDRAHFARERDRAANPDRCVLAARAVCATSSASGPSASAGRSRSSATCSATSSSAGAGSRSRTTSRGSRSRSSRPGRSPRSSRSTSGWVARGMLGATLVALAFILPSFVMVLVLSAVYLRFGGLAVDAGRVLRHRRRRHRDHRAERRAS